MPPAEPSIETIWRAVHEAFNPTKPASSLQRAPRDKYNPLSEKIAPRLGLGLNNPKFALAGGVGSGKSTELLATAQRMESHETKPVIILFDIFQHLGGVVGDAGAINRLEPAELVGLLGLAVLRAGRDALGIKWGNLDNDLSRAIASLHPEEDEVQGPTLDVARLAGGMAMFVGGLVAGPGGALTANLVATTGLTYLKDLEGTWEWKVGLPRLKQSSDQDSPVKAVLQATNALLDRVRQTTKRELILFVDGLDQIKVEATFSQIFVESALLQELRCSMVTTMPLGLAQRYRSRMSVWQCFDFTFVPVVKHDDHNAPNPVGMAFFEELCDRRFLSPLASARPTKQQIHTLAIASGGRLRDFMSLMRSVAVECMLANVLQATDTEIAAAIDTLRRERESGLDRSHIDTLRSILSDKERRLPPQNAEVLDLLDRHALLAYPNQSTWYLPHPILIRHLLQGGSASSS